MSTAVANIEKMIAVREKKATEIATLEAQLVTARLELGVIDKMLSLAGLPQKGTRALQAPKATRATVATGRRPKTAVKEIVLEIVRAAGPNGINADGVVEKAKARGKVLPIESVLTFLRRSKSEGLLDYDFDGERFKLKAGS